MSEVVWLPMSEAPKDGRLIKCRGFDFGDPTRKRHYVWAKWDGRAWISDDEQSMYWHLTGWHE